MAEGDEFETGDRVRVAGYSTLWDGTTGMIEGQPDGGGYWTINLDVKDPSSGSPVAYFRPEYLERITTAPDSVNHPAHYTQYPVEVIEITEHLNFCRGNAVKYICRAGHKGNELEDLRKSLWYIKREIERLEKSSER